MASNTPQTQRTVRIGKGGLLLGDDQPSFGLYSGSLHYWRLDRALWQEIIVTIRELGFSCVDTYIPWSVHEESRGFFSFEGNRDVEGFFELCRAEGLFVIARPGPHINAELTEFGYPSRVVYDERMQARTAAGTPALHVIPPKVFPIIGYCSDEFYAEVEQWLDVICPIIARHQYPDGPVVLVQADNEHSYFFKLTPYDVDYSDSAVTHYRNVIREKYGTIDAINEAYRAAFSHFDEIDPPRSFDAEAVSDLPRYLDWAMSKERYLTDGIERIASMLKARGVNRVPISHNSPGWFNVPYNQTAIENTIDVHGVDYYAHRREYESLKQGCLYLAGTSRLPFIPEFGAGTWPWWEPINDADAEMNALAALMHGIKAINYYMLVERERWLGAPIGRRGDLREPSAQLYRRLLSFLSESDWTSVDRQTDVLLLCVREYERLAFVSRTVSPPFSPDVLGPLGDLARFELLAECNLGFAEPIARTLRSWFHECGQQLSALHHAYALGDSESSLDWLLRFPALVVPTFDFMTRTTQQKLCAYAERGGQLVIGPNVPRVDERGEPCTLLAEASTDRIHVLETPNELGVALSHIGIQPPWSLDNASLDLAVHHGDDRSYTFVANPTWQNQTGTLRKAEVAELRDVWRQDQVLRGPGAFTIDLNPNEIRVFSC